ncbi:MAG: DUF541 domain-containing protein [Chloroflexi bacterium]|nr:MAG: DUF541 domain-containing protein [Chloroflexota bacterium]
MYLLTSKRNLAAIFLLALAVLLIACSGTPESLTTASTASAANIPNAGITVIGQGKASGTPDQAQVQVGVETFADTVSAATAENEATIQRIMDALEQLGIDQKDIQTTNYSLWAEQIYGDRGPEGIAGYRVNNQVNVTIRDIDKVGQVLSAVTEAGANTIYGVFFTVSDPGQLEAQAREEAMNDARARAESLAELAGVELGDVVAITEVIGQPVPLMDYGMGGGFAIAESAVSEPSISPGELNFQTQIQVTFSIR